VTSTVSGEGKTFAAINLAGIMNMAGKRVVLLDLDLRKPKLHRVFEHDNNKGMSTLLIGKHGVDEVLCPTGHEGLDFIPSGPIPPNPAELIISEQSRKIIHDMRSQYDVVICDTPPVGLVADALELLKLSEFPIYIIRADYSRREFVNFPNRLFMENGVKQLSIVLNDIKIQRGGYGRYNYGYGYGYGYYDEHTKRSFWRKLLKR
jgi:capsular exopolysaccharide synthesis family protein